MKIGFPYPGYERIAEVELPDANLMGVYEPHAIGDVDEEEVLEVNVTGVSPRTELLILVAVALAGATLQAAILHYRGAFNNLLMFAPLTVPVLAIVMSIWAIIAPNYIVLLVCTVLFWLTFLIGFVGLGMHLRGFGRQMGGLYLTIFNWLEGPPAFAPALFTGFAAVGLIAVYFL